LIIQKCDNLNENEFELNPELFKKI
jgi:hypothetical protein